MLELLYFPLKRYTWKKIADHIDYKHVLELVLVIWKQNSQDTIDSMCSCDNNIESTIHIFLHCLNYSFNHFTLYTQIFRHRNKLLLLKLSYVENRILKTHLFKKLLMVSSTSYYEQRVSITLYFPFFFSLCIFNLSFFYLVFIAISWF